MSEDHTHIEICTFCLNNEVAQWKALAVEVCLVLASSRDLYNKTAKNSVELFHQFENVRDRFLAKARSMGVK